MSQFNEMDLLYHAACECPCPTASFFADGYMTAVDGCYVMPADQLRDERGAWPEHIQAYQMGVALAKQSSIQSSGEYLSEVLKVINMVQTRTNTIRRDRRVCS